MGYKRTASILILISAVSCTQNREDVKLKQYMVQGQILYRQHCSNCHQENGQGLGKLYPPLAQSDYMLASVKRSVCGIKNGINGEIVVNGERYNQAMNGYPQLTDIEIAEITTYIYNSWENNEGLIAVDTVSQLLDSCNK